jgi:hypothetical protein
LPKDQQKELTEWNKANGGKKGNGGKKCGKRATPGGSPCNTDKSTYYNKKFKSMLSEMEARHTKMYEALADVQSTSIAAIQATLSPASTPRASSIGAMIGTAGITPEVMIEGANMAMLKLTGILKSKDKA